MRMNVWRNPEINHPLVLALSCVSIVALVGAFLIDLAAGIWMLVVCAGFWLVILIFMRIRYQAISNLSYELDRVLHNNFHLPPDEHDEGELSILRSEICKMTITLREQAEALEKDKLYLSDSMSDISHQLKTPLASMYLIVSLMQKGDVTEQRRRELLRDLQKLLERMNWLVASLLKISKLDAGTAEFQKEAVSVRKLIQTAADPLLIPMELRNETSVIECDDSVMFEGDSHGLRKRWGIF